MLLLLCVVVTTGGWDELSEGVFLRAYDHLDINICVIRDGDRLLVIDSRASPTEGAELMAELEVFAPAHVNALVNTHAHFDHTFGNQQFGPASPLNVAIYGHHLLPAHLDQYERPRLAAWRAQSAHEPPRDWHDVVLTPPTHLVASRGFLQLRDRVVELIPLGPGHTDTDLVIRVCGADIWIVGDIVEASGPPMYGSGCYPLELPGTLRRLLDEIGASSQVVPGHGPVVDRDFALAQLADVTAMAAHLRAAHDSGATVQEALASQATWPFPVDGLQLAVSRAFAALDQQASR